MAEALDLRLHIFGASGSGTTTLGQQVATRTDATHLDTDDFYWQATEPQYTTTAPRSVRISRLTDSIDRAPRWVLSGSLVGWGDLFIPRFSHCVFVTLPPEVRMARLLERQRQRFGDRIERGGDMYRQHNDFMDWARAYDTADLAQRSLALHEAWIKLLPCPLLRVASTLDSATLADMTMDWSKRTPGAPAS